MGEERILEAPGFIRYYLSIYLFSYLSIYFHVYLSIFNYLSIQSIKRAGYTRFHFLVISYLSNYQYILNWRKVVFKRHQVSFPYYILSIYLISYISISKYLSIFVRRGKWSKRFDHFSYFLSIYLLNYLSIYLSIHLSNISISKYLSIFCWGRKGSKRRRVLSSTWFLS